MYILKFLLKINLTNYLPPPKKKKKKKTTF